MRSELNARLEITLSKKQIKWLKAFTKAHNMTPSMYIRYLLNHKAGEFRDYIKLKAKDQKTIEKIQKEDNTIVDDDYEWGNPF